MTDTLWKDALATVGGIALGLIAAVLLAWLLVALERRWRHRVRFALKVRCEFREPTVFTVGDVLVLEIGAGGAIRSAGVTRRRSAGPPPVGGSSVMPLPTAEVEVVVRHEAPPTEPLPASPSPDTRGA